MRIALSFIAVALLATPAGAASAQAQTPTEAPAQPPQDVPTEVAPAVVEAPKPDEDPQVCRREMPTGSRIAVKVCMKKSQWVARSTRSARVGEPTHVDGFDDKAAPLPPSN